MNRFGHGERKYWISARLILWVKNIKICSIWMKSCNIAIDTSMARLYEKKGIDVSQTYRNVESWCKEFFCTCINIAAVEHKKIEQKLKDAKCCAITAWYASEIVNIHSALKGEIHCYFLGLIECEHANREEIFAANFKALLWF